MKNIKKMLSVIIINIIALFFVTLKLPDTIPSHIGLNMKIDGYGSKWFLIFMGLIPLLLYISSIRSISSKLKINEDYDDRGESIIYIATLVLVIFLSWIFVFLGFQNKIGGSDVISFPIDFLIVFSMGLFITIASNYFGTIKQNRVVGIRVPWTLSNEFNWRKTHKLASYTGVFGGIVMCIFSVVGLVNKSQMYSILGLIIGTFLFAAIPIIYSFLLYKKGNI